MGQGRMPVRLSGGLMHTIQEIRAGGTSTDARRDTSSFLDPNARLTAATTAIKISLVQNLDHPRIGCRGIKRRTRPNSGREGFP